MQKYIILFAIVIMSGNCAFAQCDNFLKKGEEQYNKKEYKKAIDFFSQASVLNCPGANDWIGKCNARIKEQETGAVNALVAKEKEKAAKAKVETEAAKVETEAAKAETKAAKAAKEKAEAEAIAAKTETAALIDAINDSRAKAQAEIIALEEAANKRNEVRRLVAANLNSNPTQSFDSGDQYKYKGETSENTRNGLGVYLFRDGTIYWGEFKDDNMSGAGIYIAAEGFQVRKCRYGIYYSGGFSDNLISGTGYCYDELGNLLYNGIFANDKPVSEYPVEGDEYASYKFEVIDYDNNGKYIGSTVNGQRNGLGVYFWDNGDMWFGNWENGQRDGYGIHISFSGAVTTGTWNGDDYSK